MLTFFDPEFEPWKTMPHKARQLPFVTGWPLLHFESLDVLVVCTGMGPRRAAAAVTALGFDPRLDVRKSLWLISGVSGIDPLAGTVGDVAWASYITDMASAYYIDRTEDGFPPEWETPWIPLTCTGPFCDGVGSEAEARSDQLSFELDQALVSWAFATTRDAAVADSSEFNGTRAPFAAAGFTAAARPPSVIRGDTLSGATVWVGFASTRWARKWVPYWTGGRGVFTTSAMEDSGVATGLAMLGRAKLADPRRLLSLRSAANFCTQPPGTSISAFVSSFGAADASKKKRGTYWRPGYDPVTQQAAVNVFQVAMVIVQAVAAGGLPSTVAR